MATKKIILTIAYLLLATIIFVTVMNFVYSNLSETRTEKNYLVNDLGLILDSISIDSKNFEGTYQLKKEYKIKTKENELTLSKELDNSKKYYLISNQEIEDEGEILEI